MPGHGCGGESASCSWSRPLAHNPGPSGGSPREGQGGLFAYLTGLHWTWEPAPPPRPKQQASTGRPGSHHVQLEGAQATAESLGTCGMQARLWIPTPRAAPRVAAPPPSRLPQYRGTGGTAAGPQESEGWLVWARALPFLLKDFMKALLVSCPGCSGEGASSLLEGGWSQKLGTTEGPGDWRLSRRESPIFTLLLTQPPPGGTAHTDQEQTQLLPTPHPQATRTKPETGATSLRLTLY